MSAPALLSARISAGYQPGAAVLRDFELEIQPGEVVGLIGESGSGKSTIALAILRLLEHRCGWSKGEIRFRGENLLELPERRLRGIRGRDIALVLQSPLSALNPAMRIGKQLMECWQVHRTADSPRPNLNELLEMVNLPAGASLLERLPRQLSVGQAQRVLIAMAILHRPALLIADEPTSALDAVTQAEILALLSGLNRRLGMSILYISHDLLSVASLCQRTAILRQGQIVETGPTERIFAEPRHEYTRTLVGSLPGWMRASC